MITRSHLLILEAHGEPISGKHHFPAKLEFDGRLWSRIKKILPKTKIKDPTHNLPMNLGVIEGKGIKFKLVLVNGTEVRKKHKEFFRGGNDSVYDFIPYKTIWLDGRLDPQTLLPFVLYHEVTERFMMSIYGLNYNKAHAIASASEPD